MFVSTSAATVVYVGSRPSSACLRRRSEQCRIESRLPFALPFSCPVEMLQPVLWRDRRFRSFTRRNYSDYFSSSFPLDTVTGFDVEPVRDRFWHRHLQFARDLTHILTITRKFSLSSLTPPNRHEAPFDLAQDRLPATGNSQNMIVQDVRREAAVQGSKFKVRDRQEHSTGSSRSTLAGRIRIGCV
jgi:hypothetical protein